MPELEVKTYYTKQELAERFEVTTRTIENWVSDGILPAPFKPSYKVARWLVEVIENFEKPA